MGEGQTCSSISKCKHMTYWNKWYKSQGVMDKENERLSVADIIRDYYIADSLICFPLLLQATWRGELSLINEQRLLQRRDLNSRGRAEHPGKKLVMCESKVFSEIYFRLKLHLFFSLNIHQQTMNPLRREFICGAIHCAFLRRNLFRNPLS